MSPDIAEYPLGGRVGEAEASCLKSTDPATKCGMSLYTNQGPGDQEAVPSLAESTVLTPQGRESPPAPGLREEAGPALEALGLPWRR